MDPYLEKATTPERDAVAALLQLGTFTLTATPSKSASHEDALEYTTLSNGPKNTLQSSCATTNHFDGTITDGPKKSTDAQSCSSPGLYMDIKSSICEKPKLNGKFTPPPGGAITYEFPPIPSTGVKAGTSHKSNTSTRTTKTPNGSQLEPLVTGINSPILASTTGTNRQRKHPEHRESVTASRTPAASSTSVPSQSTAESAVSAAIAPTGIVLTDLNHDFISPVTISDVICLQTIEQAILSDSYVLKGSFLEGSYPDDHPHVIAFNQAGFMNPSKFFELEFLAKELYVKVESREAAQAAEQSVFGSDTDWTTTLAQENAELLSLFNTVQRWEGELRILRQQLETANAGPEGVHHYELKIQYKSIGNQNIPFGYVKPKKGTKKATPRLTREISAPSHSEAPSSPSASAPKSKPTQTPAPTKKTIDLVNNPIGKFFGPNANKPPVKKSKRTLEDAQDLEVPSAKKARASKGEGADVPAVGLENVRPLSQVIRDIGAKYIELARVQEELDNLLKEKTQLEKN